MKNLDKIFNYFPNLKTFNIEEVKETISFITKINSRYKVVPNITRTKLCLYCNQQTCIKSHSISENVLERIANNKNKLIYKFNGHWYFFNIIDGILNEYSHFQNIGEEAILNSISCGYASVFDGFCTTCDNNLFASLDKGSNNKNRVIWELFYRTVAYKIRFIEEYYENETFILQFILQNNFFFNHWKSMFPNMGVIGYTDTNIINERIEGAKIAAYRLKEELKTIKNYENNLNCFVDDYYFIEEKILEKDINFLGVNYIQYCEEGDNLNYIEIIKNNTLVSVMGIKKINTNSKKTEYDFFRIILTKKTSKKELDTILKITNIEKICNYLLIHDGMENKNTFFKKEHILQEKQNEESLNILRRIKKSGNSRFSYLFFKFKYNILNKLSFKHSQT